MYETVNDYLNQLHFADVYKNLDESARQSAVFTAEELLKDYFPVESLTDRAIALQVLYMLEGEGEDYAMLKRQGVAKFTTKNISVEFGGGEISPNVINLLSPPTKAYVGRLI